jgi:hypothetical protein
MGENSPNLVTLVRWIEAAFEYAPYAGGADHPVFCLLMDEPVNARQP